MAILDDIKEAVVDGETDEIQDLVQQAIDEGLEPGKIINEGLIGGMNVVAPLFRDGEMFVPEVMESADTMKAGIEVVKPLLGEGGVETKGKIVIGTVDGDLHDIGKNLVVLMLESNGYEVEDLGIDVPVEKFAEAITTGGAQIVGLSAMLTTTMMQMDTTIKYLADQGLRDKVKIIVGGAPITQQFADEIAADGFSTDAAGAVALCDQLLA
ncbi:MAG: corrinoid protein [Coriobacteriales bacterium]|nr:corrinoid protein [Coriobacteriales bacterium]